MKKLFQAVILYCWFVIGGLVLLYKGSFTITQFWYGVIGSIILATIAGKVSGMMVAGWILRSKGTMNPDELKDKYMTYTAYSFFAFVIAGLLGLLGLPALMTLLFP